MQIGTVVQKPPHCDAGNMKADDDVVFGYESPEVMYFSLNASWPVVSSSCIVLYETWIWKPGTLSSIVFASRGYHEAQRRCTVDSKLFSIRVHARLETYLTSIS